MAYLSDDELLDTEGGFTGWDDGTGTGAAEETLEQALAEERLAELENELEQDEHPIDYEAELEDEEEEAAPVSDKRLKREMRAEAIRRLEEAARTEKDFRVVVEEWNKLDRNRERRERDHENLRGDVPLEYQAVPEPKLIPRWMNNPAYRQLMAGNFLDILFDCPYEMHNLTADPFISRMVEELSGNTRRFCISSLCGCTAPPDLPLCVGSLTATSASCERPSTKNCSARCMTICAANRSMAAA